MYSSHYNRNCDIYCRSQNAASQISIIKEQNKHDLEKLMEQHKVDIEHLKEAHRLDMEAKEQDHKNKLELQQKEFENSLLKQQKMVKMQWQQKLSKVYSACLAVR